jgi:hypothetical protein
MSRNKTEKLERLSVLMGKVNDMVDLAWPRDGEGRSTMPEAGIEALIDIQIAACRAMGLPENTKLMSGNPLIDL